MSIYSVYKITCTINNKLYIGQTEFSINHRFSKHITEANCGRGYAIARAIRKYGKENFTIELICVCNSRESASLKEKEFIQLFQTTDKKYGYNLAAGGYRIFPLRKTYKEDIIYRVRELALTREYTYIEIGNIMNIPTNTIEHMVKGSSNYNRYTVIPPIRHKLSTWTSTTNDKISATRTNNRKQGKEHPQAKLNEEKRKQIIRLSDDGISRRQIARLFGVSHSTINNIVNNRTKYE